jgi:hypothetical protein
MYPSLLVTHSLIRYFVLIFMIWVIVKSYLAWRNGASFTAADTKASLWLVILSHVQLLLGLALYAVSPYVKFTATTMKDATSRYWAVEHVLMMLIAVTLITIGRVRSKKAATDAARGKALFWFNAVALLLIVVAILTSDRGFFSLRTA